MSIKTAIIVGGKEWLVRNHSLHEGTEEKPLFYTVVFHKCNIKLVPKLLEGYI
jgi:hypothetical protein